VVAEARLLEPQILLHVLQLVGERDVGPLAREGVADEVGELGQQLARLLRARVDERRDGGQRVVDEVRRDLGAQRAQLGDRQPLALRVELRQLDHGRDERRRLPDDPRVLDPDAALLLVERHDAADARVADPQRRDDRRAQRAALERARDPALELHAVAAARLGEGPQRVAGPVVIGARPVAGEQRVGIGHDDRVGPRQQPQLLGRRAGGVATESLAQMRQQ
jgi:hypothetical protein